MGRRLGWILAALVTVTILFGAGPAFAVNAQQDTLVDPVPGLQTPDINDGTVNAMVQVGSKIIVGGDFTNVTPRGSSTAVSRPDILAFDATTGALDTAFVPALNGTVLDLAPGPVAGTVYVAGSFGQVDGVKAKGVALLDTQTGQMVNGFAPAAMNGAVYGVGLAGGRLYIAGTFTSVGGAPHLGVAALDPNTGAVDPFVAISLTGHHNYHGSGAEGAVGPRTMDISPDGSRMILAGNFTQADGLARDQIVMVDLTGNAAAVDPQWATLAYTAACFSGSFDTYLRDVDFAPDGSYFVVVATGGSGTNSDGTKALCDSASRWETAATGSNVRPSWIDYTGQDTLLSVAVTGTAVYVGGHQRWLNNTLGFDSAGAGAVPRPGLAALDPVSGMPYSWNPGRNPRGAGASAILATAQGLYVGSDTEWIGDFDYRRKRIAYFPLAGGEAVQPDTTRELPGNVYSTGQISAQGTPTSTDLTYRAYDDTPATSATLVPTAGTDWSQTRGAFMVGNTMYYGLTDGNLYERSFDGTTLGAAALIDPYDDPKWSDVQTGSGQTYRGKKPTFYAELPNITGAFYLGHRIYYTQANRSALYSRWFEPESGIVGADETTVSGGNFSSIAGLFHSGDSLYYAARSDGTLHRVHFSGGVLDPASDTVVSGGAIDGIDWRTRSLFVYGGAAPNQPPVASISASCEQLNCTIDGSGSSDPDGTIASYSWNFGDGTTGSGVQPAHTYSAAGRYTITLTVTDDDGATASTTQTVAPTTATPPTAIDFVGAASANGNAASESVTVPAGVQPGDAMVLIASSSDLPAGPAGWTAVDSLTNGGIGTDVWTKVATAADAGSAVSIEFSTYHKASLQLLAYRGAGGFSAVQKSGDVNSTTHTTPVAAVADSGSWAISYWAEKSSATATWIVPGEVTARDTSYGSGSGRINALVADSAGPVSASSYGGITAGVTAQSSRATMWTLILRPAS
ncbi:MAG TPA: PKD domain-containing protein [Mycobacteriales bacterium]|nr:PKD domain-containing protein [Mycobacteriales bacterium]